MRRSSLLIALVLSLPAASTVEAAPARKAETLSICLDEARWLVSDSAPYTNGSARTREMLRNSEPAAVLHIRSVCRALATADSSTAQDLLTSCNHAVAADAASTAANRRDHAARQSAACAAMAHGG